MPPRQGQLDQISEAIGELRGLVTSIEKYVHEGRHGVNNLSQKFDALAVKIASDIAAVEARIDTRLTVLETAYQQQRGAKNLAVWLLQSPIVGWLAAAALFVAAWWKGVPHK